ncbi:MAG: hypothetical protein ACM3QS_14985 [Bacteroidota bacterium]
MSDEPANVIQEVPPPKPILTQQDKLRRFLIGLLGWWLVNIPLWLLLQPVMVSQGATFVYCTLPFLFGANIFLLIIMAFRNRWVALGLLAAFAVNLLVSLVLGLGTNAMCWIPFTTPAE